MLLYVPPFRLRLALNLRRDPSPSSRRRLMTWRVWIFYAYFFSFWPVRFHCRPRIRASSQSPLKLILFLRLALTVKGLLNWSVGCKIVLRRNLRRLGCLLKGTEQSGDAWDYSCWQQPSPHCSFVTVQGRPVPEQPPLRCGTCEEGFSVTPQESDTSSAAVLPPSLILSRFSYLLHPTQLVFFHWYMFSDIYFLFLCCCFVFFKSSSATFY